MSSTLTKRLYQFQLPLLIISFSAGIIIAQYFFKDATLDLLQKETVRWGTIVTALIAAFAYVSLILSNARRISGKNVETKNKVRSIVFLLTLAIFAILGLSDPVKLTGGNNYNMLYTTVIAVGSVGLWVIADPMLIWASIKRLLRINNIETLIMLITFTIEIAAEGMTMVPALYSPVGDVGVWVKTVPNMIGQRAAVAAAGVGAVILGLRALVWREPGLVEVQMQQEDKEK